MEKKEDGTVKGMLNVKGDLTPEQLDVFKEKWNKVVADGETTAPEIEPMAGQSTDDHYLQQAVQGSLKLGQYFGEELNAVIVYMGNCASSFLVYWTNPKQEDGGMLPIGSVEIVPDRRLHRVDVPRLAPADYCFHVHPWYVLPDTQELPMIFGQDYFKEAVAYLVELIERTYEELAKMHQ